MSKFLLIGSVAAMLYGDCAWGMEDNPWNDMPSSGSGQFNTEPAQDNASPNIRSRRNSTTFSQDKQTQTEQSQFEQSWNGQTQANPQQFQENRFIKIEFEEIKGFNNDSTGAVLNNTYMQYHYAPLNNSKIGRATPTTVVTVTRDDLKCWNDIAEIRYSNDVSYDKLENPKVILYRNKDNSCYIILRIGDNKHGVFYGINERNIEVGRSSFAVYDLSEDVGSFTDSVARLIYVDESGLYFVPKAENSVEDVIKTYQSEGKFNFKGSVIKVSAIDGSITLDDAPVTEDNFFDNWVLKETKQVSSTKQPGEKEVLRNFYPPKGNYEGILKGRYKNVYLNAFSETSRVVGSSRQPNFISKEWLAFFIINKGFSLIKADDKKVAEQLVRNGVFASILSVYNDKKNYHQAVRGAIATQVAVVRGYERERYGISDIVKYNSTLFKDPEFVRSLKPAFKELEKDYEHNKESELWLPFEIVRNL
ncbi:MAG: hypothetical protein J6T29_01775 [Alphaproteobacteria bacterium]|nr:hypothetical protein [Alphaproteobacteria bacterium]